MPNVRSTNPLYAWEDFTSFLNSAKAFFCLCGSILLKPVSIFRALSHTGSANFKKRVLSAVLFALILGYLKIFFVVLHMQWLWHVSKGAFSAGTAADVSYMSLTALHSSFFFLRPLIAFAVTLALLSLSVKLVLGLERPLWPVFFVVCYKSASDLFYAIPVFGSVFATIWSAMFLVIGFREVYALPITRSFLAAIAMPLLILLSVVFAFGTSLSKAVMTVFPEVKKEVSRINDTNAYYFTKAVIGAAQDYKKDLGFYPISLNILKKYLSAPAAGEVTDQSHVSGYIYEYTRLNEHRFILIVRPVKADGAGGYVFYSDETGAVRLNDAKGSLVESTKNMKGF